MRWDASIVAANAEAFYISPENRGFKPGQSVLGFESMGKTRNMAVLCALLIVFYGGFLIMVSVSIAQESQPNDAAWLCISVGVMLFSGFAVLMSAHYIAQYRSAVKHYPALKESKTILTGELMSVRRGKTRDYLIVRYQFVSPTGALLKGEIARRHPDFERAALPYIGSTVHILYLNDEVYVML